mgnify:CR=1 FL=1
MITLLSSNMSIFCRILFSGVMEAYRNCLRFKDLQFHEPMRLAPVIQRTMNLAQAYDAETNYFILLILMHDGFISDAEETIRVRKF